MRNCILASTSTVHGQTFLQYLTPQLSELFKSTKELLFIPFARPSGISYQDYTSIVAKAMAPLDINVKGIHNFTSPSEAIDQAEGIFIGGGNTFVLLKTLHELELLDVIRKAVHKGVPFLGTSAGSNVCGPTICTTNDMPIVYPPSFEALCLIPFQINPHYIDADASSTHMGETRETRLNEYHHYNATPVLGLREGSYIEIKGSNVILRGTLSAPLFRQGNPAIELESGSDLNII